MPEGSTDTAPMPVYILGGRHADLPLDPGAGVAIADLIVNERLSLVLDMSQWDDEDKAKFAATVARELLLKNQRPLHLFVDEADVFIPQEPGSKAEWECRRAFDRVVRQGRIQGFGVTMICQRPAAIAKNALSQTRTIIALQLTDPTDLSAIENRFKSYGDAAERKAIMGSVARLGKGDAWFWSPEYGRIERVHIERKETFDSSSTPVVGAAAPAAPKYLTAPDLEALGARLQVAVETAKENDVDALKAQIAALKKTIADGKTTGSTVPVVRVVEKPVEKIVEKIVVKEVEVPALAEAEIARLESLCAAMNTVADGMTATAKDLRNESGEVRARLESWKRGANPSGAATVSGKTETAPKTVVLARYAPSDTITSTPSTKTPSLLPEELRMLTALASYPANRLRKSQLSLLAKVAQGDAKSTWGVAIGNLTALTLIRPNNPYVVLTPKGKSVLAEVTGKPVAAPSASAMDVWRRFLKAKEVSILVWLLSVRPRTATKNEIGRRFSINPDGSTLATYLSELSAAELIVREKTGKVRAADDIT